ncbi:hypothetical protein SCA6_012240 [Theobroma cacao]
MASKPMFLLLLLLFLPFKLQCSSPQTWIKAGYWDSSGELPVSDINSALFTHLFCAFAYVNSTSYQLLINSSKEQPFSEFTNTVKLKNPSITTLLSIRVGKSESTTFSLMINQTSNRKSFIKSSVRTARLYGFHGLDLVGVMPRNSTNMTSLGTFLDEWRAEVDSESRNSGKTQLLLTMSFGHVPTVNSVSYPIDSAKRNLDWVNIIAYDYYVPTVDRFTGVHAALYDPFGGANTDAGIREWLQRGFSADKLVLGLPYHGFGWTLVNSGENDIGSPASGPAVTIDGSMGYKLIKSFIQTYGYGTESVYNSTYVVSFCKIGSNWINFDDVEAIKAKVSYAKAKGLLGYNVFQLSNDENWLLSQAAYGIGTSQREKQQQLLVIVLVTVAAVILLMGTIVCYLQIKIFKSQGILATLKKSVSRMRPKISSDEKQDNSAPNLQVFSFNSIKAATDNFSSENKLGQGGYGPVYKAYELWKQGRGAEFFDASLDDSSSTCKLMRCMQVALLCVQESPADRPSMVEVFASLKNETVAISIPKQPAFSVIRDGKEGSKEIARDKNPISVTKSSEVLLIGHQLWSGRHQSEENIRCPISMASKTIFILLFNFLSSQLLHFSEAETWVKAGYWYAYGEFPVQDIDSALFTHLLCAFAEVNPSTYQLFIPSASEQDFSTFTSIVKRKNPSVKTLLSVWNGISETGKSITGEKVNDSVLSSMISESSKRKSFIDSSMKTARRYGFHGIDLSWP